LWFFFAITCTEKTMPIYKYEADDPTHGCAYCRQGFELLRQLSDPPLTQCPRCSAKVAKRLSAPNVGASKSGLDRRAQNAGFHKLQRLGKGEYEKKY
jgi:putative FmdB family regulatory protein